MARRLIIAIVLVGALITLGTTWLQLSIEYRRDLGAVAARFGDVERAHLASVAQNAWLSDRERLQLSLDGIRSQPDFDYAEVVGESVPAVSSGERRGGLTRTFPLVMPYRGQNVTIGRLNVEASLQGVHGRLVERAWVVLMTNGLLVGVVAAAIYALIGRMVTRRLYSIAAQSRRIGGGDLETPLTLPLGARDEIADLGEAIDAMRLDLKASNTQLRALNDELQASLIERTAALEQSRRAQQELAMAASVFANTQEGIVITTGDAVILSVNKAFCDITGFTADEVRGATPRLLKSHYQSTEFYQSMWRALADTGRWQGELWNRRKNGEAFRAWETISTLWDEDGKPEYRIAIFSDVTELRRQEERLHYQAHFDALTGLANRALFRERLDQAVAFAARGGNKLAVLMLDLDRFKMVNDSLGHEIGDRLLKQVAERLTAGIGAEATIARLGGDEFAILVWHVEDAGALANLAETLVATLRDPFLMDGHEIHLGISVGVALYPEDGDQPAELIKNADVALYRVKEGGRNGFRFFDASMNSRALDRLDLEAALRRAAQNEEFELHYQPKVTLPGGIYSGAEALIRWRHPTRGLVPPLDFIPLAEETGLIAPIGEWALREACRQIAAWRDAGLPVRPVAVNVSARQFAAGTLPRLIQDALAAHDLPSGALEVELTESILMTDPRKAAAMLGELAAIGVSVAIDDFGTGYSSLNYLKQLPLHALKIDRSFVKDVVEDQRDQAIVQAIIAMARALNLSVVAEGVETVDQLAFLAELGCDLAQGYHFAKPLPAAELPRWLAARKMADAGEKALAHS